MRYELKPCQCKSQKVTVHRVVELGYVRFKVKCNACGIQTALYDNAQYARKHWNNRPAEDALKVEIVRLMNYIKVAISHNGKIYTDDMPPAHKQSLLQIEQEMRSYTLKESDQS